MAESRIWAGNTQNKPGSFCNAKSNEVCTHIHKHTHIDEDVSRGKEDN